MTLADEIFAATLAMDRAEIKAYELLVDLLGENGCTDWTTDHYDRSIEIFGVAPGLVLSEAQQRALREAGFSRCWTHAHQTEKRQPGGRAYVFTSKEPPCPE